MAKRIYLCLAHMSETGLEQKYIKEAFDTNWVVPLGPNVNGFEDDLRNFVNTVAASEQSACEGQPDPCKQLCPSRHGANQGDGAAQSGANQACGATQSGANQADGAAQSGNTLAKEVVALSAGTAAVHLGLIACGVGPGDEVCVQSFTFCASSHPVKYLGATPVFIDSEPDTWNMDPELLEKAILDRKAKTGRYPKAIVPVALYGMPYQIDRIMEIADKYGIPVVEDAAEGFGSRFHGQVLGTFGRYGVLSFNGNKMITTSGGGALICPDRDSWQTVMMYATQFRESYPYYQHEKIGYNYRMSNICAGIGRGQMTVLDDHIAHHRHIARMYEELFAQVKGINFHKGPDFAAEGSNYWLNTITLDPSLRVKGQENAYAELVKGAVGGAAGVIHTASSVHTDCEPNDNVEAMRVGLDAAGIEARPVWKPMHRQPIYADSPAYLRPCKLFGSDEASVSEAIFKVGMCLPSGPMVTDEDVRYIVETVKGLIIG